MKLLILEDGIRPCPEYRNYLKSENYHCEYTETIVKAHEKISHYSYDCVVLDRMIADGNRLEILLTTNNDY